MHAPQAFKTQDSLGILESSPSNLCHFKLRSVLTQGSANMLSLDLGSCSLAMQRGGEFHCTLTGFHWRRWGTRPVKNCSTRDSAGVGSETQGGIRYGRKKAGPQCTKGKGHGEPLSQPMSQLPMCMRLAMEGCKEGRREQMIH